MGKEIRNSGYRVEDAACGRSLRSRAAVLAETPEVGGPAVNFALSTLDGN